MAGDTCAAYRLERGGNPAYPAQVLAASRITCSGRSLDRSASYNQHAHKTLSSTADLAAVAAATILFAHGAPTAMTRATSRHLALANILSQADARQRDRDKQLLQTLATSQQKNAT